MTKLMDLAAVLRSKNAGPLWLTLDVMFDSPEAYQQALHAESMTPQVIAALYGVNRADVSIIPYPIVQSIKVTLPRQCVSGDIEETDVYGCQQHLPLASLTV